MTRNSSQEPPKTKFEEDGIDIEFNDDFIYIKRQRINDIISAKKKLHS